MPDLHLVAVLLSAVVAFLISGGYYAALGERLARLSDAYAGSDRPGATTVVVELVRNLVVSLVVAGLSSRLELDGAGPALLLALALWVAFPVVLLAGSVFHERVSPALAAIHAGDWLLKLAAISLIVTLWR